MKKITIFIAGILVFCSLYLKAVDNSKEKEFVDIKCKITLPDGAQWLDQSQVPGCKAFFKDSSERLFILLGGKSKHAINNAFVTGFDSGFLKSANASKISGEIIKFKKVPCYQLYVKMKDQELYAIVRVFFANGYCYQLQLIGDNLAIKKQADLDKVFSSFEFIGKPSLPKPTKKNNFLSNNLGMIVDIGIVCIILFIFKDKTLVAFKKLVDIKF